MGKRVLSREALEARNAYMRAYRAAHPEKFAEYRRRYWEKLALSTEREQEQRKEERK